MAMVAEREIPARQWTRTRALEAFAFSETHKRLQVGDSTHTEHNEIRRYNSGGRPMNSTDLSNQGRIFSQKLSLTGTRRKWDSGMKSGLGQVLLAFRT